MTIMQNIQNNIKAQQQEKKKPNFKKGQKTSLLNEDT